MFTSSSSESILFKFSKDTVTGLCGFRAVVGAVDASAPKFDTVHDSL